MDRETGRIEWPTVLQAAAFDDMRARLDGLFRARAAYSASDAATTAEIRACIWRLKTQLRGARSQLETTEYLAAQKFLSGLKYSS